MTETVPITDEYRYYLLRKKRSEELIINAFRRFREVGIEPILIKGWAAERNYPSGVTRFSGDVDLAVSYSDYAVGEDLVGNAVAGVDLHRELRHLDTLPWDRLFANSELVKLEGEDIRILCAEDHLRVLCVHWLTNGGESRDRLMDIVYAVQNRPRDFDWAKCLEVVSNTRRKWVITTIGIAHKYLGLDLDGLPFASEAERLPVWLTECLEKEWSSKVETRVLAWQLRNPRNFYQQLRKRIPPNPIQATISCEGDFDDGSRIVFQIRDAFKRIRPSAERMATAIAGIYRARN